MQFYLFQKGKYISLKAYLIPKAPPVSIYFAFCQILKVKTSKFLSSV